MIIIRLPYINLFGIIIEDMYSSEDYYYCCEEGCTAPNKMMTTFADQCNGLHNGHELRGISQLRAELTD